MQYNTNGTLDTSAANSITIGGTNANAITIGKSTATQPTVSLQGGTGSAFTITSGANSTSLAFSALSAGGKTVSIPNETGTICTSALSSNSNCTNYAPSTLGTGYIQNQIAGQQSASNFWISSVGRTDGAFLTPTLDTPSAVALNIGTSGGPTTTAINLNQNTTIASGKSLTANGAITQSGGAFSLAGNGPSSLSTTAGNALTITSAAAATWSTNAGALTIQGFGGTSITTPAASGAVTSTISVATGNVTSGAFASGNITVDTGTSTGTTGTITIGGTSASAVNLGHVGISVVNAGTEQLGISAGTGALVNNGTTVNTSYPMANLISGGWDAGGAAATVDKYTYISANQISTGQTLTVPNPTAATSYGRILYISNIGSASFSLLSTTIGPGSTATLIWANANGGAAWTFAGADGSGILNQSTSDQTANFRISGTGRANTSLTTPLIDSITGGLNVGTGTATGITIGGAATTGVIGIGTAAASTLNIGTGAFAHTIAVGTDASTVQGLTIGSTNASSVTTLQAGSAINLNSATVATNQTTVSLFNAAASVVNEFGAATTINVGAANAVVTYGNGSAATLRTTTGALTVTSAAAATWSTGAGALSIDSAAALNLGITSAAAVSIGKTTTTTNISGTTQIGTLNTAGTGALVNNGITKNATLAIGDLNYIGTGNTGALGTAAATVDIYTAFTVNQATAGQTITIPTPTVGVAASTGRIIYISNIGATSFTLLAGGATMNGSSTATLVFNGTAWTFAGADGNGILNQSAVAQAASFFINGTGKASTSLLTPLIDSISGVLSIGTGTATGITVGGSTTTGTISVGNSAASTINIGTSANAHTIGIGSDPTTVQGVTLGSTSGASATTINGGSGNINLTVNQAGAGVIVKTATTASATAFQVQNTVGMALLLVDTANAGIRIGDTTNFVQYTNGTREPVLNGTARHAKNLIMTAEFAGAVLDASGTSNTGTMTAAFEPTQRFGYYKWISSQASAQNYDIVATVPVPDDFSSFTGTPTFWNFGSVGSSMAVTITDTAGTVATNYNASALTVSTTWTSRSVATPAITGTYTQGSNMIIRIKLTGAALTGDVRLGTITLPYLSRY